ncbi:MAG: 23S rRNA (adenine(2503)-C(2))-methyltransferase RlmN, partial [Acidimicrobiales bacterium]
MTTLYDADPAVLADLFHDQPPYRVGQVWRALHRQARWPEEMTDLPPQLRERLGNFLPRGLTPVDRLTSDGGETVKWLWALNDGARVESVLMCYPDRVTVCV